MTTSAGVVACALALLLLLMVTGCVPVRSLYPFFEPEEVVFDPRLLGQWAPPQKAEFPDDWTLKLRFQESKDNAYALQLTSHNRRPTGDEPQEVSATFRAHLFRVGELLFLDVELEGGKLKWKKQSFEAKPGDAIFVVATHSVFRVKLNGDRLQLAYLDDDPVQKLITQGKLKIPYREPGIVLSASPKELRESLLARADDTLFPDDIEFTRQK